MSIEERRNEVIEFCKKGSLGQEYTCLAHPERRAAKAANLPDGPGEAKTA